MKFQTFLGLAIFSTLTCASHAASSLAFPGQPNPDPFTVPSPVPGEEAFGVLNGNWSVSQNPKSDLLGFYTDIGGYRGVGVGALVDDYSSVPSSFSISSNTATVGVAGATLSDWFFQIDAPTLAGGREAYSIDLAGTAGNLISIDLAYNTTNSNWDTFVNGVNSGAIFEGGLYQLSAVFGAGTLNGTITSFDGAFTLPFSDSGAEFSGNFSSLTITTDKVGPDWGNGYLSVVPEPSSVMLISVLPAFFALRRRR